MADEPIHCEMAKAEIATLHDAIAVDMESYGIARAAVENGLPWVVARVVVDTPTLPLPDLGAMNVRTGRPPLSGIAKYVLEGIDSLLPWKRTRIGPTAMHAVWRTARMTHP